VKGARLAAGGGARTPSTTPVEEIQKQLLLALDCVERERSATYVSGPITTGRRFVEWYLRAGYAFDPSSADYRIAIREQVICANEQEILGHASLLRGTTGGVVIEPTSLRIDKWSQADFHRFWGIVIERYCRRMVVLDGWEYSVGCVVEFRRAINGGVCVQRTSGEELSAAQGRELVRYAAADLGSLSSDKSLVLLRTLSRQLREQGSGI
jgi:hypothetical protein